MNGQTRRTTRRRTETGGFGVTGLKANGQRKQISGRAGQAQRAREDTSTRKSKPGATLKGDQTVNNAGPARVKAVDGQNTFPSFGPARFDVDLHDAQDRAINISLQLNYSRIRHIVTAVVTHGINVCGDEGDFSDYGNIAKYIFSWMIAKIGGNYLANEIDVMPATLVDIVNACTERRVGPYSFIFALNPNFIYNIPRYNTDASFLAKKVFGANNVAGGFVADTYDELTACANTRKFFLRCRKQLDVVDLEEYNNIDDNDPSAFALFAPLSASIGNPASSGLMLSDNTSTPFAGRVYTVVKPRAQWLARLGIGAVPDPSIAYNYTDLGHVLLVEASPGAIVVDRMIRGLRGYDRHSDTVEFKWYDIATVVGAYRDLIVRLGSAPFSNAPGVDVGLAASDIKAIVNILLRRLFANWLAVGVGVVPMTGAWPSRQGVGNGFTLSWNLFKNFQVFQKAFTAIGPYSDGTRIVYPILYASSDPSVTALSPTYALATSSMLQDVINMQTYQNQTSIDKFWLNGPWISNLSNAWNLALMRWSANAPVCGQLDASKFNATCFTQIAPVSGIATNTVVGMSFKRHVPDHIWDVVAQCWIPHLKWNSTAGVVSSEVPGAPYVMYAFGEPYSTVYSNDNVTLDMKFISSIMQTVHPAGNVGTSEQANVVVDSVQTTAATSWPQGAQDEDYSVDEDIARADAVFEMNRDFAPRRHRQREHSGNSSPRPRAGPSAGQVYDMAAHFVQRMGDPEFRGLVGETAWQKMKEAAISSQNKDEL